MLVREFVSIYEKMAEFCLRFFCRLIPASMADFILAFFVAMGSSCSILLARFSLRVLMVYLTADMALSLFSWKLEQLLFLINRSYIFFWSFWLGDSIMP